MIKKRYGLFQKGFNIIPCWTLLFTQIRLPQVWSYVMIKNLSLSVCMKWIKVSQPIFAEIVVSFSLKITFINVLYYMSYCENISFISYF